MKKSVNIDKIPEFLRYIDYTVKRTSGVIEDGWILTYREGTPWWHDHIAFFDTDKKVWRIYMNNSEPNICSPYAMCGWRHLNTIHPTCYKDDEEKIEWWRITVLEQLEALDRERISNIRSKSV